MGLKAGHGHAHRRFTRLRHLAIAERLDSVMALWGHLRDDLDRVPVRQSHLDLAAEQLAAHRASPEAGEPAVEALERVLRMYR